MIKVNLQNIAVNNMLTGQNTLDSIFIDGNSILFITKPEYLKQLYRDEIRARSIKMNLKIAREEIHKRTQDVKQAEYTDYVETEGNKARMVLDILALDVDRLERDCQWLQKKGCGISMTTTPGVPLEIEGGTLEEAIAALIEEKAA